MTGRLTRDEYTRGVRTVIEDLMMQAGRDFEARTGMKNEAMLLYFNRQLSLENIEELPRMHVEVSNLTCAWRHELFDDAQFESSDEVPAVTVFCAGTPFVMLGSL
jgi:hypothetical protein